MATRSFSTLLKTLLPEKALHLTTAHPPRFGCQCIRHYLAAVTFGHKVFLPVVLAQSLIGAGTVWCAALLAKEMFAVLRLSLPLRLRRFTRIT